MGNNPFKKASKQQLKARLALAGPTGAGKTWTALEWASKLGKRIAVIDTERGSASLYADQFEFDTLPMAPPYEPAQGVKYLRAAEANGYDVVIIDSLTHFWQGEGGTLDMVDAAAQKHGGNKYAGWSVGTPALRNLVDTMLGVDLHVIVTMRSKMDYVEVEVVEGGRKKKKYERVGMAPVMRDGIEYEFTLMGDLDLEHRIVISKSRCSVLADTLVQPGRAGEAAETFLKWLETGVATVRSAPAKTELIEACGGDTSRAAALWQEFFDGYTQVARDELDTLLEQARNTPTPSVSTPNGSGDRVADDAARDPEQAEGDGRGSDEPPASARPAPTPDADAVPISQIQNRRLHALLNKTHPGQDRHQVLSKLLGREVASAKDLTVTEANRVIDSLDAEVRANEQGAAS